MVLPKRELPRELDIDADGYPAEPWLESIRTATEWPPEWLLWVLPAFCEIVPYGGCEITDAFDIVDGPVKRITFHCGGWSGAEDFIGAVLANDMLNAMYYAAWKRGGHYTFEIGG